MPQPWLEDVHRRTLRDVDPIIYTQIERHVYNIIMGDPWPYSKTTGRYDFYVARDRCLMALLFRTMGRVHEVLRLTKDQFDFDTYDGFLLLHHYEVGKRKEKTIKQFGRVYIDIPLAMDPLFMPLIQQHLDQVDSQLFRIGRNRAYKIVNHVTGLWCHWFRAQAQTWYVNKVGNPAMVSDRFKVNIQTIMHYYQGDIEEFMERVK